MDKLLRNDKEGLKGIEIEYLSQQRGNHCDERVIDTGWANHNRPQS
jgi:hypothetical protein